MQFDLSLGGADNIPEHTIRLVRAQNGSILGRMTPPRDITGWTVKFEVRDKLAGASVLSKTTGGSGIVLTDPGNGFLTVTLAKADTSSLIVTTALTAGKGYVWEITRTDSGSQTVLARGQLILEQEVIA